MQEFVLALGLHHSGPVHQQSAMLKRTRIVVLRGYAHLCSRSCATMAFMSISSFDLTLFNLSFSDAMCAAMRVPVRPSPALQCNMIGPLGRVFSGKVGSSLKLSINWNNNNNNGNKCETCTTSLFSSSSSSSSSSRCCYGWGLRTHFEQPHKGFCVLRHPKVGPSREVDLYHLVFHIRLIFFPRIHVKSHKREPFWFHFARRREQPEAKMPNGDVFIIVHECRLEQQDFDLAVVLPTYNREQEWK